MVDFFIGGLAMERGNLLLNALSPEYFQTVEADFELVDVAYRQPLMRRHRTPEHVYFPAGGLVSVVGRSAASQQADVGTIGREGCTAVEVILGCERAQHDAVALIPGVARRIETGKLLALCQQGSPLRWILTHYACIALFQAREIALVNARGTILQRVAYWILLASEKMQTSQLLLTHDDLSMALGVRRAGVTIALGRLVEMGVIHIGRGRIEVSRVEGLIEAAKGYYRAPALDAIFGQLNLDQRALTFELPRLGKPLCA